MENPVRKTTLFVLANAKDVTINHAKIEEVACRWAKKKIKAPPWHNPLHLSNTDEKTLLTYLFILDSLNFCFWAPRRSSGQAKPKKWHYSYRGKRYSGYFGLAIALKAWFEKNPEKANFEYFSKISWKEFCEMFQGGENLLFLEKRWEILRSVSRVFVQKYNGDPARFVRKAEYKFSCLVPLIVKELPSFADSAIYKGKKVWILKRAQILAGDIWGAFGGRGIGAFNDLGYVTAFADYKLPQILRYWGVLAYSPALEKKIKKKILIPAGSGIEVEIRAATAWAVEYLKNALCRQGISMSAHQIDWILWNESKRIRFPLPHHLTKTVFY